MSTTNLCECRGLHPNEGCSETEFLLIHTYRNHLTSIKSLSIELATTVITELTGQGFAPYMIAFNGNLSNSNLSH